MLHLSASDRVRPLADALAGVLAVPLDDPMRREWIAVPTEGMHRWLQLELARRLGASEGGDDGVAANIEFPFPGALRQAVLAAGRADDRPDPWDVDHLVWAVLDVLHTGRGDERLGPLTTLPSGATWFGRARRLADLFDRYAVRRPELLRNWHAGRDLDATGAPLAAHDRWQAHLWRATRACIGEPSPPERLPALLDRLHDGTLPVDLPPRLALFGITTLPGGAPFLALAEAIGAHRELHLLLLDPSPTAVARVRAAAGRLPPGEGLLRSDDRTDTAVRHPLLRSWGRPYRERTLLLADAESAGLPTPAPIADRESPEPPVRSTLLARVQRDLRDDAVPAGNFELLPDDRSIQVHSCHGEARQVDVLRDAILHLLADDPTLREDDVVVLSPSIDEFAPFIEAGFGTSADRAAGDGAPGVPRLAYRITDRSLRESAPLLAALDSLLALVAGRFTASGVLELLSLAPVRERFDLDDDAIAVIGHWITETNVRWGLDGEHRVPWGVPADYTANTWRAALDRLLMGVAVSADDGALAVGEIAPFGVEGSDITVVGRLADVLAHLAAVADDARHPRPAGAWCETLLDATRRLFAVDAEREWQLDALRRIVAGIADAAAVGGRESAVELTLADVRRLLAEHLEGSPRRPEFFRGGITFSSLNPLRWLPFRVVCLLGLDEAALATGAADGDDLAMQAPRLGDRDARAELRQWLLEAVLAAGDHLIVTRTGHNILTNQDVPESVAFAELRDTITATLAGDARHTFLTRVQTVHPHQPFDARCFEPGALGDGPWSFDATALAGAEARARREAEPAPFLARPLADPAGDGSVITLAELQRFFNHPVKAFFTGRLRVHMPREDRPLSDHLPTTLDPLDRWSAATRLIEARVAGRTNDEWMRQERARGSLPAGGFGDAVVTDIAKVVDALLATAVQLGVELSSRATAPIDVVLADGTRIVGTVDGRGGAARPGPARLTYSRAKPKHLLTAWLDLVALVADDPEQPWRSVFVRRNEKGDQADAVELVPRGADLIARRAEALDALGVAVDCYRRGRREPLPLFAELSPKLYDGTACSGDWNHNMGWGDGDDEANQLAFGVIDLRELRAIPARADDPPGHATDRAGRFAEYLWGAIGRTAVRATHDETSHDETDDPAATPVGR